MRSFVINLLVITACLCGIFVLVFAGLRNGDAAWAAAGMTGVFLFGAGMASNSGGF